VHPLQRIRRGLEHLQAHGNPFDLRLLLGQEVLGDLQDLACLDDRGAPEGLGHLFFLRSPEDPASLDSPDDLVNLHSHGRQGYHYFLEHLADPVVLVGDA